MLNKGGKFIYDEVYLNNKKGGESTRIVGYGKRQRALSSHVNKYLRREFALTSGYFLVIVGIEKIYL
jgi:hypothetical protein